MNSDTPTSLSRKDPAFVAEVAAWNAQYRGTPDILERRMAHSGQLSMVWDDIAVHGEEALARALLEAGVPYTVDAIKTCLTHGAHELGKNHGWFRLLDCCEKQDPVLFGRMLARAQSSWHSNVDVDVALRSWKAYKENPQMEERGGCISRLLRKPASVAPADVDF